MTEALDTALRKDHENAEFNGTAFDAIRKLVKYLRAGSKYGHSLGPQFTSWCDIQRKSTLILRHHDFIVFAEDDDFS